MVAWVTIKMRSPYREAIIVFFTIMSVLIVVSSEKEREIVLI